MFGLDGFWLLGALVVTYLTGIFTAQWAKDKISGVPSDLRAALSSLESTAKNEIAAAKTKVVADTATLLTNAKAKVASDLNPAVTTLSGKPVIVTPVPTTADPVPAPLTPTA